MQMLLTPGSVSSAAVRIAMPFIVALTACECTNDVKRELPSPDGAHKAVLFERNCGTASNNNLQVSVVSAHDQVRGTANVIALRDTTASQRRVDELIKLSWENATTLRIEYDSVLDAFAIRDKKVSAEGIVIHYKSLRKGDSLHAR